MRPRAVPGGSEAAWRGADRRHPRPGQQQESSGDAGTGQRVMGPNPKRNPVSTRTGRLCRRTSTHRWPRPRGCPRGLCVSAAGTARRTVQTDQTGGVQSRRRDGFGRRPTEALQTLVAQHPRDGAVSPEHRPQMSSPHAFSQHGQAPARTLPHLPHGVRRVLSTVYKFNVPVLCHDADACRTSDVSCSPARSLDAAAARHSLQDGGSPPWRRLPKPRTPPGQLGPRAFTDRGHRGRPVVLPRGTAVTSSPQSPQKMQAGTARSSSSVWGTPCHRAGQEDRARGPRRLPQDGQRRARPFLV